MAPAGGTVVQMREDGRGMGGSKNQRKRNFKQKKKKGSGDGTHPEPPCIHINRQMRSQLELPAITRQRLSQRPDLVRRNSKGGEILVFFSSANGLCAAAYDPRQTVKSVMERHWTRDIDFSLRGASKRPDRCGHTADDVGADIFPPSRLTCNLPKCWTSFERTRV